MSIFPEGMDMSGLLAQAQALQAQFQQAQDDLAASTFVGSAGGDLVEATMSGSGVLERLVIKPEAVDVDDLESLADLIVAAVRDATSQVNAKAAAIMPTMPNLPF